ncbi:uncharacterized protein GLRG_07543 [Colletotrichum graminicola M1.001]|uniref:Uncharacterized protein n=1 Tax=Colletotrichum graminicola (strain M1.001 / M2 / FGSC 10212) TaxID=645133 RepID=E3QNU1_COLGM|nr:uncharacterized protein GLRG_07543 [Colletotrichum graminicola M1.001]EFQ32529.1 hypothetical protein GLRG_07543 [Colletotrichum graminicola M1.001]
MFYLLTDGGSLGLVDCQSRPYIVLTRPGAKQEAVQEIKSILVKNVVPDSLTWITSARTGLEVLFQASITSQQAGALAILTGVNLASNLNGFYKTR